MTPGETWLTDALLCFYHHLHIHSNMRAASISQANRKHRPIKTVTRTLKSKDTLLGRSLMKPIFSVIVKDDSPTDHNTLDGIYLDDLDAQGIPHVNSFLKDFPWSTNPNGCHRRPAYPSQNHLTIKTLRSPTTTFSRVSTLVKCKSSVSPRNLATVRRTQNLPSSQM
jgi:hypothetical protein